MIKNKIINFEKAQKIEKKYGNFISLLNDSKLEYFIFDDLYSEDCLFVINTQENCFDDKTLEKEFDDRNYHKSNYCIVFKSKQNFDEVNYPNLIITKFKENEMKKLSDISEVYNKIINKNNPYLITCIFNNVKIKNLNLDKIYQCRYNILFLGENEIENITINDKKIRDFSLYLNNTIKKLKTLNNINEYKKNFGRSNNKIYLETNCELKELINFKSDITIYSNNSQLKRIIDVHINKLIINNIEENKKWNNKIKTKKNNHFKEIINSNIKYVSIDDSNFNTIKNSEIKHLKICSKNKLDYSKQDIFDNNMNAKIKYIEDRYNLTTFKYINLSYSMVNNSNVFWIIFEYQPEFREYNESTKAIFDINIPNEVKEKFVENRGGSKLMVKVLQNNLKIMEKINKNELNKLDKYGCDVMDYCFNIGSFNVLLKNGYNNFTKEKYKIINSEIKNLYEKELLKKNSYKLVVPIDNNSKKTEYKLKNNVV